jgi:hypothetical protein
VFGVTIARGFGAPTVRADVGDRARMYAVAWGVASIAEWVDRGGVRGYWIRAVLNVPFPAGGEVSCWRRRDVAIGVWVVLSRPSSSCRP